MVLFAQAVTGGGSEAASSSGASPYVPLVIAARKRVDVAKAEVDKVWRD